MARGVVKSMKGKLLVNIVILETSQKNGSPGRGNNAFIGSEEGYFPDGLLGMTMLPIIGSVIAICRLLRWGWFADEEVEREENDEELSLPVLVLVWFIKIAFVWPIYWPCWLMYKTVFVAVPTGVVLCVAGVAELQKVLPKCKIHHNAEK